MIEQINEIIKNTKDELLLIDIIYSMISIELSERIFKRIIEKQKIKKLDTKTVNEIKLIISNEFLDLNLDAKEHSSNILYKYLIDIQK